MKRLSVPLALLAVTLAGCGGNDSATSSASTGTGSATVMTTASASNQSSQTDTSTSSDAAAPSSATSSASPPTTTPSSSPSTAPVSSAASSSLSSAPDSATTTSAQSTSSAARTQVVLLDPRTSSGGVAAGYTVENHATDDLWCGQSGITGASIYARGRNVFTCGPTASALEACWQLDSTHIGCIRGVEPRKVIRLPWSGAPVRTAATAHATPIRAILSDGTVCTPKSHDQEQHYQNRQGWYLCGDMTLLAKDSSGGTGTEIDMSTPLWTADAAVGTAKPHTVTITKAYFAQGD